MAVASVGTAVERTLLQRTIPALAGGAQYPAQPSRGFLPPEGPNAVDAARAQLSVVESMSPLESPADASIAASEGAAGLEDIGGQGCSLLTGAIQGTITGIFQPELRALQLQVSPEHRNILNTATSVATFTLSFLLARAAPRGLTGMIGSALSRIPLLGGEGYVAASAQVFLGNLLGSHIGEWVGSLRTAASPGVEAEAPGVPVIRIADTCVICHEDLTLGDRQVAALSCGHACMCVAQCQRMWSQAMSSCPVCRREGVNVVATVRL
mmetsp:Transcript_27430/g.63387  ORF Transcript_27430/g.63387 Transcript_27430/m.63387 type:complete len:267 (-) Transcript_27430:105-905(-)